MFSRNTVRAMFLSLVGVIFLVSHGIGEDFKYESRGRRDPFVPLVGADRPVVSKLEDITSVNDLKLEGIASGSGGKIVAILNGEIVKEGDRFGDIEIGKVNKKSVAIVMSGKKHNVDLIEDGGVKSER